MRPINYFLKNFVLVVSVVALLGVAPACKSKVVMGRSAVVPQPKAEMPAPEPVAPPAVPEEAPPEPAEKPAPEPPAKPAEAAKPKLSAKPQSTPATPEPEPETDKPATAVPSPYQLDLSFGGFGLGIGYLDTPVAVAVDDETEDIYVVDQGNYRIQKFDRYGIFQFAFGRQGMGDGEFVEENVGGVQTLRMTGEFEFNRPLGILFERDNTTGLLRLTVVDTLNYRLQRFLLTTNPGERFPDNVFVMLPKSGINIPDPDLKTRYENESRQVILDPMYISDVKADNFLLAPFVWGGLGFSEGLLNIPTYITKDDEGYVYVADTENGRVQGFFVAPDNPSSDATFFREFGNSLDMPYGEGRLNSPTAVAFDNSGFGGFLVLDKLGDGSYNITRFDREGNFVGVFATSGGKEGQFRQPVCIAVNLFDNTVFVTDKGRRKIMVYNNNGEFLFEFGGEELADPRGITVLRNNFVYVTDAAKNMVYRYIPK